MADRERIAESIKTAGSMAIYVGTASIMKPIIKEHNQDRNAVTKVCSVVSGTVISCGISHVASKWFGKIVDKVYLFINDIKNPKTKGEREANG